MLSFFTSAIDDLHARQYVVAEVRAQGRLGYEVDLLSDEFAEREFVFDDIEETLLRAEFDEDVYIAVGSRLPPRVGAEYGDFDRVVLGEIVANRGDYSFVHRSLPFTSIWFAARQSIRKTLTARSLAYESFDDVGDRLGGGDRFFDGDVIDLKLKGIPRFDSVGLKTGERRRQ